MKNRLLTGGHIERFAGSVQSWTKFSLLWLLLAFVLRIAFFFMLNVAGSVERSAFGTILLGAYFDITLVFFVSAVMLVPYVIINWFLPKIARVLSVVFITLYVVAYCCLMVYYVNVTLPLDHVFLVYSPEELYNIVVSSVKLSFWSLAGVLAAVIGYSLLLRFWNRKVEIRLCVAFPYAVAVLLFVTFFDYESLITSEKHYKSHQDYTLSVNQMTYTINDFMKYYKQNGEEEQGLYDEKVLADAAAYQSRFPDFNYIDSHYPFLRYNNDPDVLGVFLNKTSDGKAPDFVFIIVESLGQRLSSSNPMMSFTPFLDSLKKEGLYWPNCLALAERTFGVVPNVFSSAPYDKSGFARKWWPIPDHNSILKDMSKNGYSLSFYYGGNAAFDGQDTYFAANGVDYMMDPAEADFDDENKAEMLENHSWGMYDKEMFNAAIKHRDTVTHNRPNTDVYITLSTHEPFYFKGQEAYIDKVKKMLAETVTFGPSEKENVIRNDYMYATYLYADECIKYLFDYYKNLPEFENTVFVIVGDHRTGCVYVNRNPLLPYNVPLIIYSPLIKTPKTFKGVVTHHDIVPTIDAYLHGNYDYKVDDECHWLGTTLDTSAVYHNSQSVAFMRNNRDVDQYLHGDYMLDRDRVYQVDTTLFAYEIENDSMKDQLKEYLRQYKNIDRYATRNDFLIKKPDDMEVLLDVIENEQTSGTFDEYENVSIHKPLVFDKNYEKLYINISFNYSTKTHINQDETYVVFKINDKNGNNILYKSFRFSEMSSDANDGCQFFMVRTTFFMINKDVVDLPMQILLFPKEKLDIEYRDLKIKVEGLPLRKK